MFNEFIDTTTTTTLCLTVFYPLLYTPYTRIRIYVLHSRPTDFHSSTRLNSGSHSAELVQSTKTTTDPSRIFLVARHTTSPHLTTTSPPLPPPPLPQPRFLWLLHSLFCESLNRATTPQATPWLEHFFLSIYLSLSPALSPAPSLLSYRLTQAARRYLCCTTYP